MTERTDLGRRCCRCLLLLLSLSHLVDEFDNHKDYEGKNNEVYDCVDKKTDI